MIPEENLEADEAPAPSNLWNREPVLVVAFVQSLIGLGALFGLDLTVEQTTGILVFVAATLSLIVRRKVSPVVSDPAE